MGLLPDSFQNSVWPTAIAASVATASAIVVSQHLFKRRRIKKIKSEIALSFHSPIPSPDEELRLAGIPFDESLIREQLSRNYAFLGEERMQKVRSAFVVVVGVGGVGSHAAHMLLRSGVEKIRVIDFDQVTLSSLNRHAVATHADVGTPKTACLRKHFRNIAPWAEIDSRNELFTLEAAPELLAGKPDFVLDCIDNLNTKIDLIKYCKDNNLRIISSMGAGAKCDPSRIQIADISETFEDPLARATRRGLKLKGVEAGVPVVYSTEKPGQVKLLPLEDVKVVEADQYAALPDFRARILPVLGTLPALFGNTLASYCITELAGFAMEPLAIKLREKTYQRLHTQLVNKEKDFYKSSQGLTLNIGDVGYIFEEIWRGRSALGGGFDKLQLTRWDVTKPAGFGNCICLTRAEAEKFDKVKPEDREAVYGREFIEFVEKRLEEEKSINQWR
ncbi:hypothetical protein BC832DRAFT_267153 [Gaertneriomyces semiglobifer]|nr:hypothetical protein BC832DRAFT_267153 [Gaertneriomyces semiglobifer]